MQKLWLGAICFFFFFFFFCIVLGDWYDLRKLGNTGTVYVREYFPVPSSGSFMVLYLMFKSLSHFEFIFVHDVKMCSNFIHLCVESWWWTRKSDMLQSMGLQKVQHEWATKLNCPTFPTPLAEETSFFPLNICASFAKLTIAVWVYFWTLYSVPLTHMSVFIPVPHCFDNCSFIILPEVWEGYASYFGFSSSFFSP